ncbi:GNAT family N-acetyltransferase [Raoultibacter phocaeensis]|uniref:GNAT family N-acetyltransferase n=1 Tax=Raoultibacter phocaeensis TaxID=2479841 RepID=UPI0021038807|nr:GNAT family N-acetyltransferase [Raoultibacter phocaeensis]
MSRGKTGETTSHVVRGIICAAAGGICWGFSGTCAQLLTTGFDIPVAWITCVRLLSAAAIFLVICVVKDAKSLLAVFRDRASLIQIAGFALLGVLLTQMSYLSAISYTNAGTGTVLERLGLLVIMVYVCIRTRRLPHKRELVGLVLAMAGVFLIATKGNFSSLAIPPEALFWGGISAIALAFYTLLPVKVLKKWGSLIVTGLAMLMGGVVATAFVQPWTIPVTLSGPVILVMALMTLIGTVAAYVLYLQGITDAGPVRAGLVGCVEPVAATFISAVWLHTPVTLIDIVGVAMIVVMVILVTNRDEDEAQEEPTPYDGSTDDLPLFEGRASVLKRFSTRKATHDDYVRIKALLACGHARLKELGIVEGLKKYPSARRVMKSIEGGSCYVVGNECDVIGMFALDFNGDPHYKLALQGSWLIEGSDGSPVYAALHWVNVAPEARGCGIGLFILEEADRLAREKGKASICADIYPANEPMRRLLLKHGYSECGTIRIKDYLEREKTRAVFEKLL